MLSLLTLSKLIKLEFAALYSIAWKKHIHVAPKTKAFYAFGDLTSELWDYVAVTFHYKNITIFDGIFALDLPIIAEKEVDALASVNPNRFVKSSFILSLLWTAKFYRAISDSYKILSAREYKAFKAYTGCFGLFLKALTGVDGAFYRTAHNCDRWVRGID